MGCKADQRRARQHPGVTHRCDSRDSDTFGHALLLTDQREQCRDNVCTAQTKEYIADQRCLPWVSESKNEEAKRGQCCACDDCTFLPNRSTTKSPISLATVIVNAKVT